MNIFNLNTLNKKIKVVFVIVIMIAFKIIFYFEMYQNIFFKVYF